MARIDAVPVRIEHGYGGVVLHDPDGETHNIHDGDDASLSNQVRVAVRAPVAASAKGGQNG